MRARAVGGWALAAFVATMGLQALAPPGPLPIGWAEVVFPVAALAALVVLVGRVRTEGARAAAWLGAPTAAALAYAGWVAVSAAAHRSGGWVALGALELAAVLAVTRLLTDEEQARDAVLRAWIVAAALYCGVGLGVAALARAGIAVEPLIVGGGELDLALRPAGLCRSGMLAALCLAPLLVLAGDGARLVGRWRAPLAALIGATVLLTLTRTLLAVGVGLALLFALHTGRRALAIAAVVLGVAAALASMRVDLHGADGRFRLTARPGIRWRIAASALAHAASAPLVGTGPATRAAEAGWPTAEDPPLAWDAHSTALDLAATRGVPALVLWLLTVGLAARDGRRRERSPTQLALLAALGATLFDAITIDVEDARHAWLLLGLVSAPAARSARR